MNILLYLKKDKTLTPRLEELLNIASRWKAEKKGKLFLAILGEEESLGKMISHWPIDKVFLLEVTGKNGENKLEEIASSFQKLLREEDIHCICMGNSIHERELAPYLSAVLNWNFIPNVVSFSLGEEEIEWERFLYGTRAMEESRTKAQNYVVTFSRDIYRKEEKKKIQKIEYEKISPLFTSLLPYLILNQEEKSIQKHPLESAKIVIGIGKGIKGKENFSMVEELADLLGATIGVTRSVVDNGWRPEYEKIGQTGKIIKPELYLGFGISGAMQHMAGVQQARHIVMVNNNPNAESFRYCDFGIVADLFEVIPKLIMALKNLKG